jgi:hypothetical protein
MLRPVQSISWGLAAGFVLFASLAAIAQTAPRERQPARATVTAPAVVTQRVMQAELPVIVIEKSAITQQPLMIDGRAADQNTNPNNLVNPMKPAPRGAATELAAPLPGKLNITLTPKSPAAENRAYLGYEYPNNVRLSADQSYVMYSRHNIAGGFRYSARLDKGKKYLMEIEAKVDGGKSSVQHGIGGQQSTHELTSTPSLISAVISPAESGWINGVLRQEHSNPPDYWYVYSLTLRELD